VQAGLIVKEAVKFFRATAPATVQIECDVRTECLVTADPVEVRRIVVNLCTNAVRAMREGGGTLRVALEEAESEDSAEDRRLKLTVVDSGCGMEDSVAAHAFEPFYSAWDDDSGAGMGLSVVHGIVTRLGGAVRLETRRGEGTSFEVYLPVRERRPEPVVEVPESLPQGRGRVFFVDDEDMVRDVARESLAEAGFEVIAFPTAIDALAAFDRDPSAVDIVVTDMTMPRMTGDELVRRMKAVRPDLPVVLCTGYSEKITPEGADRLGVDKFLLKPVDMFYLADTLVTLLAA
jgi:CheY-like chemotaxis protein/anti-sigma regulatory factor (Ser/Thr protein kinase)